MDEHWEIRSNTKQDLFNKETNNRTKIFLKDTFMPSIIDVLRKETTAPFEYYIDETDPQTVLFAYPRDFNDATIFPVIKLEIRFLAAYKPVID